MLVSHVEYKSTLSFEEKMLPAASADLTKLPERSSSGAAFGI